MYYIVDKRNTICRCKSLYIVFFEFMGKNFLKFFCLNVENIDTTLLFISCTEKI